MHPAAFSSENADDPSRLPACDAVCCLARDTRNDAPEDPPKPDTNSTESFDRDVKPIFAKHCLSCHGADKQKHGLRLDRKTDALKGGDSGAAIVPGKSAESLLFQLVSGQDKDRPMPPKGGLSAAEIATLKAWIDQGAKWPDDGSTALNPADWWSLKPLTEDLRSDHHRPQPPTRNPIDQFILAKLREKGLTPSPRGRSPHADSPPVLRPDRPAADARSRSRRSSKDDAPDAYEKLVDSLLASPRYGERWARHWLDVVHYGETHGYDKDQPRPNAWPYRDYVIRAFNDDKPYDRFVQEQVAGDVLFPGHGRWNRGPGFPRGGAVGLHRPRRSARNRRSTARSPGISTATTSWPTPSAPS